MRGSTLCSRVALGFGLALLAALPLATAAQEPLSTIEGYSVQSLAVSSPINRVLPLAPPFWAVAAGPYLLIADDTDPHSFEIVAQTAFANTIQDMTLHGTRLYLAIGTEGLVIMDVTNPLVPVFLGSLGKFPVLSVAVNANGDFAYVCSGDQTFQVLNVKDPSHIKQALIKYYRNANFYDVLVTAKTLVTAAGPKGVIVYSIEDPNNPIRVKRVKGLEATTSLALNGKLLAATDGDLGTVLVNFPTWTEPEVMGSVPTLSEALDCAFLSSDPTKVLVAEGANGFRVVDASDPHYPTTLSITPTPAPVVSVSAFYPRPYLSCSEKGLYYVDLANPSAPQTSLVMQGQARRGPLAVTGNFVLASADASLESWDFSDPGHPIKVGSVALPSAPTDFTVSGNLLMASCLNDGLLIFDITNPAAPHRLSTFSVTGSVPGQVSVQGSLMAVAAGELGVLLVNVSTPSAPVQVGSWVGDKYCFISGTDFADSTTLWVMDKRYGFRSLNVADPAAPVELGKASTDSNFGRIYCRQGYVYCAAEYVGVVMVDASDPSKPELLDNLKGPLDSYHMFLSGDALLLSDGKAGIRLYDLGNPAIPRPTAYFEAPGFAYAAGILDNGATVVSCREGGLWGLLPDSCDGPTLKLPCDGSAVAPFYPALFSWAETPGAEYMVEISTDPGFPEGDKTRVGTAGGKKKLEVAGWVPGMNTWTWITKRGQKGKTLYWRVATFLGGEKTYSEARVFTIR